LTGNKIRDDKFRAAARRLDKYSPQRAGEDHEAKLPRCRHQPPQSAPAPICGNSVFALDAQTNCGLINFASGR